MTHRLTRLLPLLTVCLICGCSTPIRPGLTAELLAERRDGYQEQLQREHADSLSKLVRRIRSKQIAFEEGRTATPPTVDVLILSGGADYGAFGAGFLQGWGSVKEGSRQRPEFDVVSGVSTGALIAPFALIGDNDSYQRAFRLYQEPKEDWVRRRGLLFFLPGNASLLDISGLERDIRREFDLNIVRQLAEASKQGRVINISATNLDYGQRRVWDLGREAELALQLEKPDIDRVHKILLASSAIPGAFPPVEIDSLLYVDGATTANILYENNMRSPQSLLHRWQQDNPNVPLPKTRYWVIINNQSNPPPEVTEPTWVGVVGKSLSASVRASTATSVEHLASQLSMLVLEGRLEAEFHVVSIPDSWQPPKQGTFVKETMVSLAKLGFKMGQDPESWKAGSLVGAESAAK